MGLRALDSSLRPSGAYRRFVSLALRRAAWTAIALVAAAVFFCAGLLFRVLMGPISLGPFSGELHAALEQVLPGLDVRFDDAALEWNRNEARIDLAIIGTRVLDRGRHIVAQAPKAEIGLSAGPFFRGRLVINRITLVGVQLTLVHTKAGTLRLGVRPGRGEDDVLRQIRDAISRNKGGGPSLKSFAVHEARLAFFDEETGAFVVAPKADLEISGADTGHGDETSGITANLAAEIEISGKPAHIFARLVFPRGRDLSTGDFSISGLNVEALARDGRKFEFLAPFALTADMTGSWTLAHGTELKFADFGIGASGYVNSLGRPQRVKSLRLVGRYDGATGKLTLDDAMLAGEEAQAHLTGSGNVRFNEAGALEAVDFALVVDRLALNVPGAMERAVTLGRINLAGVYTAADRSIVLEQARISGGPLSGSLAGRVVLDPGESPEVDMDGRLDPIAVRDLLPYWPLKVSPGARAWIASNVEAGRLGPVLIHTRFPAGALQRPALPDDALSITFPLVGGTFVYLRGLTPLTNVTGSAILTGDNFRGTVSSAQIGPLSLTDGHVSIANLDVHGTPADIIARITGGLPQFFSLLDMKPLQYPTRFHLNTRSAAGTASFDAFFHVPTFKSVSLDTIRISAKGSIKDFALSLGPHTQISDGSLDLSVDNTDLHASGKIALGTATLNVDWTEAFNPPGNVSTRVKLQGVLDDAARAALGLSSGGVLTGPVGVNAWLQGYRGSIQTASLQLDLTQATLAADVLAWKKQPGTPSAAQIAAQLDNSGNLRAADVSIEGPNLTASGKVAFAPDGALQSVAVPSLRAGADNDFGVVMREGPGGVDLSITGRSIDASGLLHQQMGNAGKGKESGKEPGEPFHLVAKLDRLDLKDGVALSPFALDASGRGRRPATLSMTGGLSRSATLAVSMTTADNQRHLMVNAGDAGLLLKGLLGNASLKGGDLNLQVTMPPVPGVREPGNHDDVGDLTIRNCTLVNQPFLTRAFSSGSFGGLMDLMRGQGIALDAVHIPFQISGDVITIHDARASGPSIGVTADGYIDRATNQIALQGALAPLYGINGLLGAIPVLGDVFVSKKGEGLFGVTYTLQGDIDEPKVSTNPLSVLAPGILRRLFEGAAPKPAGSAASSAPPPQR
jgi:hypothetical protein